MASRVIVSGVATQACLCCHQRRNSPPSRTSSSSSSADGGLRLVLSPAPRCRHRHCGYIGVATHIGGAPRPCVGVVVLMARSWNTGVASRIGGGATLPPHCRRRHRRCTAVEARVAPASRRAVLSSSVTYGGSGPC